MNVVFVDDDVELLNKIKVNFDTEKNDFQTICFESLDQILDFKENADIIFLDILMPGRTGLDALPEIKSKFPNSEVIMYTIQEDEESLYKAFQNGATGYLIKNSTLYDLSDYIKIVRNGGSAISAKMANYLFKEIILIPKANELLNEKESKVLELLAEGWSYKLIADKVGITIDGVRFYIKRIYKALNVNSKGEAIRCYFKGQ